MEMMGPVHQKAIDWCFKDNNRMKRIAWDVLWNCETERTHPKRSSVKPLEWMALKVIMEQKMTDDVYASVLFALIFKKYTIRLENFLDRWPCYGLYRNVRRKIVDKWTGRRKPLRIYKEIRKDPYIMYSVFEQSWRYKQNGDCIDILVERNQLIISYVGSTVAKIRHREHHEFDLHWATRFFQLCLKMYTQFILLKMEGEGILSFEYMRDYMEPVIESANGLRPIERSQAIIEQGNRFVYQRFPSGLTDHTQFITHFEKNTGLDLEPDSRYYAF